ncbi:hypothetical protein J7U46_09765 [Pelomonas sp. V22]|uniref:hypothetical protein n=1 Tax=Pelomonas sp. V22 TaxID=2822139 RepID=UPI0024A9D8CA|nr:hypothetical protein [Pelomonas sp. V22]MDI4633333.1 hypothetical protein [Pelomonas sp. V22]
MTRFTSITLIAAVAILAGCGPDPDMEMRKRSQSAPPVAIADGAPRVTVERIGVFLDDLAYGERRGVYVIRDNATGKEFIGVSGVGITETGSHQSGKVRMSDER